MPNQYLALSDDAALRRLESIFVYKISADELYEIGPEAYRFMKKLNGTHSADDLKPDPKFLRYCVRESLIERLASPICRPVRDAKGPRPSLRYLELLITRRCTRSCGHCYLGRPRAVDLPVPKILDAIAQFEAMGGLRLLLSGGEPLLHPRFDEINEALPRFAVRKVLLTNGDLLTARTARRLNVHEAQVSIDGLERGHDAIRGRGSFRRAIAALRNARDAGIQISAATMVHRYNIGEMEKLREFLIAEGVREWGVDAPCAIGRLDPSGPFYLAPGEAGKFLGLAFGGSYHGGSEGWACGMRLAAVSPEGKVLKCGFYNNEPLGALEEGLLIAWKRKKHIRLSRTKCRSCGFVSECGGGCRRRADDERAPDPVMCAAFGLNK